MEGIGEILFFLNKPKYILLFLFFIIMFYVRIFTIYSSD
jgi:preprotein translocase subunit SecG